MGRKEISDHIWFRHFLTERNNLADDRIYRVWNELFAWPYPAAKLPQTHHWKGNSFTRTTESPVSLKLNGGGYLRVGGLTKIRSAKQLENLAEVQMVYPDSRGYNKVLPWVTWNRVSGFEGVDKPLKGTDLEKLRRAFGIFEPKKDIDLTTVSWRNFLQMKVLSALEVDYRDLVWSDKAADWEPRGSVVPHIMGMESVENVASVFDRRELEDVFGTEEPTKNLLGLLLGLTGFPSPDIQELETFYMVGYKMGRGEPVGEIDPYITVDAQYLGVEGKQEFDKVLGFAKRRGLVEIMELQYRKLITANPYLVGKLQSLFTQTGQ